MNDFQKDMHELRLIVLMESDDHKSFRQVLVNAEQFKNISDNTGTKLPQTGDLREDYEEFETYFREDWKLDAELFLGCKSIDK